MQVGAAQYGKTQVGACIVIAKGVKAAKGKGKGVRFVAEAVQEVGLLAWNIDRRGQISGPLKFRKAIP